MQSDFHTKRRSLLDLDIIVMRIPLFTEECSRHHVRSSSPQASPSDKHTAIPSSPMLSILPRTIKTIFSIRPPRYKILLPLMYVFCLNLSQIASNIGSSIRAKIRTYKKSHCQITCHLLDSVLRA